MTAGRPNLTPAEMQERAERWFNRQVEKLAKAHGDKWPDHREWLEDYLREEIRERLIALGWRTKR